MANERGTQRWQQLSDAGESLPDDLFALLPVSLQQAVARGSTSLEEVFERLRSSSAAELCPRCGYRPVAHPRTGFCASCTKRLLAEAHEELRAELVAAQLHSTAKKRLQRLRDTLDPDRPRGPGPGSRNADDYGRASMITSSLAFPCAKCGRCGEPYPDHDGDGAGLCPDCLVRLERKRLRTRGGAAPLPVPPLDNP